MTVAFASLLAATAHAAAPGITGPSFDLTAAPGYISQPDGATIYSWGYGCNTAPSGFLPATIAGANCPTMQLPGPTLIVNQGDTVTVTLHNNLPAAAGNTSILFPGFAVTTTAGDPGVPGLLTREAPVGGTVTYTFTATTPGTHTYYSGTQGDLQVEMGLYGALIVLPSSGNSVPAGYSTPAGQPVTCHAHSTGASATLPNGHPDFRLAAAAYNHPSACYDREYLFQFSEIDPAIHRQAEEQAALPCTQPTGCMVVTTEPYVPAYFMVNGRSMPDLMDPNYAVQYPNQPYNGNPHMHPGELVLLRVIGTGRWQHPFHEHGNHVRVLARDGNLLLTAVFQQARRSAAVHHHHDAGPDAGRHLPVDRQGPELGCLRAHRCCMADECRSHLRCRMRTATTRPAAAPRPPRRTTTNGAPTTKSRWNRSPSARSAAAAPSRCPTPTSWPTAPWYGGSPYLGPEATQRAVGSTPIPPSGTVSNSPTDEAGFAYMWHSHNEREITTNNAFPGGMMMMMLVDPWVFPIIEAN